MFMWGNINIGSTHGLNKHFYTEMISKSFAIYEAALKARNDKRHSRKPKNHEKNQPKQTF